MTGDHREKILSEYSLVISDELCIFAAMKRLIGMIVVGAVVLLAGCSGDKAKMLQQLELLEQQNRSGEAMLNDSLAESLVNYFDRHGDANERMRSRYILGRTYYCLDELPRALEMYNEAADCADTTSADCNYKVLSRIHAQSAVIFNLQVQPRSQLHELNMASYYAIKANDSLGAVESYAQIAEAYKFLHMHDSVIIISEIAAHKFKEINKNEFSAQVLVSAITSLLEKDDFSKAKRYIDIYEGESGYFDKQGNIEKGREIYYYIKGKYYLAVHQLDSAEYIFRKELRDGKDSNNQIAGCKGLQMVYEQRKNSDSIAKYATLSYELNDSAYLLSEMQNIQKFQASYNYNHHKLLAEQSEKKAQQSLNLLIVIIALVAIISILAYFWFKSYQAKRKAEILQYRKDLEKLERLQTELQDICSEEKLSPWEIFEKKQGEIVTILNRVTEYKRKTKQPLATLEERLSNAPVVKRLKEYVNANPYEKASQADFAELRNLLNEELPHFYTTLNTPHYTLSEIEYDVSMLLRVRFSPMDIHKLTGMSPGYVSNMRSRLLLRVYGVDGSPADYDKRILAIS